MDCLGLLAEALGGIGDIFGCVPATLSPCFKRKTMKIIIYPFFIFALLIYITDLFGDTIGYFELRIENTTKQACIAEISEQDSTSDAYKNAVSNCMQDAPSLEIVYKAFLTMAWLMCGFQLVGFLYVTVELGYCCRNEKYPVSEAPGIISKFMILFLAMFEDLPLSVIRYVLAYDIYSRNIPVLDFTALYVSSIFKSIHMSFRLFFLLFGILYLCISPCCSCLSMPGRLEKGNDIRETPWRDPESICKCGKYGKCFCCCFGWIHVTYYIFVSGLTIAALTLSIFIIVYQDGKRIDNAGTSLFRQRSYIPE